MAIYEVLFDGSCGRQGPAGDGTFIERFRSERDARTFAAKHTAYGRECTVQRVVVPAHAARRWGMA